MGEWADYKIKFANKNVNVGEVLLEKGLAERDPQPDYPDVLKIDAPVEKLRSLGIFYDDLLDNDYPGYVNVRMSENELVYFTKWSPNDRTTHIISKLLPEEILDVHMSFSTSWYPCVHWYEKNGQDVLEDGTPVKKAMYELNPKLLKSKGDMFQISVPIGTEDKKWGTILLPKKNVTYFEGHDYQDNPVKYGISVFFDTDTVDVSFDNEIRQMNTEDFVTAYYESKQQYREQMQRDVIIEGLPRENFKLMGNENNSYYIVKIPCMDDLSANGELSVTVPKCNANLEEGTAVLGAVSKERSARVMNSDGTIATKRVPHASIEKSYLEAIEAGRVVQNEADVEEYADVDLE